MGRSYTPKYRIEYRDNMLALRKSSGEMKGHDGKSVHLSSWDSKTHGTPSYAALVKWRNEMNKSFQMGGVNAHISEAYGAIVSINMAAIIRQKDGALMFKYDAPMFEVC